MLRIVSQDRDRRFIPVLKHFLDDKSILAVRRWGWDGGLSGRCELRDIGGRPRDQRFGMREQLKGAWKFGRETQNRIGTREGQGRCHI